MIDFPQVNDSKNVEKFSKKAVNAVQETGKVCVLEIDIEGAKQVRKCDLNPIYVFIMPPSIWELRRRLTGRGTEKPEKIEERIKYAEGEIEYGIYKYIASVKCEKNPKNLNSFLCCVTGQADGNFHKIVLNRKLKESYADLRDFIVQELEKQQKEEGVTVSLKRAGDH